MTTQPEHGQIRFLLAHQRELSAAERTQVDAHLQGCVACRQLLDAYQAQETLLLRSLPARTPSPRLAADLRQRLAASRPLFGRSASWSAAATRPAAPLSPRRLSSELLFLAGVALFVLVFSGLLRLQQRPVRTAAECTAGADCPVNCTGAACSDASPISLTGTPCPGCNPSSPSQQPDPGATPCPDCDQAPAAQRPDSTPCPGCDQSSPAPNAPTPCPDCTPWLIYGLPGQAGSAIYAQPAGGGANIPLTRLSAQGAAALSPNAQWLAVANDDLQLLSLDGSLSLTLLPAGRLNGRIVTLTWSPDGLALALLIQRPNETYQVTLLRLQAGLPTDSFGFDQGYPRLLGWNAASETAYILLSASAAEDGSGQIQALTPGQPAVSQPYIYEDGPTWRLHQPSLGPRARYAYYLADNPQGGSILVRQDLTTGQQSVAVSATLPIQHYLLAPDEDYVIYTLAAGSAAGTDIRLLSFSSGKPVSLTHLPGAGLRPLLWSPAAPNALEAWVLWAPDASQPLRLLRPSDQVTVTLSLPAAAGASAPQAFGWRTAPPPSTLAVVAESDFDAVLTALAQAIAAGDQPGLARWLNESGWTTCTYGQTCSAGSDRAEALAVVLRALAGGRVTVEAQAPAVNPPDFQAPGEVAVRVRRRQADGQPDSLHLFWQRRPDGAWRIAGVLLDIPYYDAPSLADVRAAPTAFTGRIVVMTGIYLTSAPGDLPADAPRLGQWALRDQSGASVWVRNAADAPTALTDGLTAGSEVQVFGLLKVEQGWPFLEVSFVQPLARGQS